MIKTAAFILIIGLRLFYQPSKAQQDIAPFTSHSTAHAASVHIIPVKLIHFTGSVRDNKTQLEWVVEENETAGSFEVEKSTDGQHYSLAAIVFGNDQPQKTYYRFFEKANNQKTLYRIKLVNKNKTALYSPVLEIMPGV